MKIGIVLRDLHQSEVELARTLDRVADRHRADHELFHLGHDLAKWSRDHVRRIAHIAERYGEHLDPEGGHDHDEEDRDQHGAGSGLLGQGSEEADAPADDSTSPDLLMLRDLRDVYLSASGVSVDWEMLGQAAQAIKHDDLLAVTKRCHPETVRQVKWANSKIKESSTQALAS